MAELQASAASLALSHRVVSTLPEVNRLDQSAQTEKERPHSAESGGIDSSDILRPLIDTDAYREPGPWRRVIAFAVIAILLVLFALIVFFGLVQSVWWY